MNIQLEFIKNELSKNINEFNTKELIKIVVSIDSVTEEEHQILKDIKKILNNNAVEDEQVNQNVDILIKKINTLKVQPQTEDVTETDSEQQISTPLITQNLQIRERTDHNLIPDSSIRIVKDGLDIMNLLISEEEEADDTVNLYFNNELCHVVNKSLKSKTNTYTLDPLNIVIRRKSFNKANDPFSWKYSSPDPNTGIKRPISYFTQELISDDENVKNIINIQYALKPALFNTNGVIYKVYKQNSELFNRLQLFTIN